VRRQKKWEPISERRSVSNSGNSFPQEEIAARSAAPTFDLYICEHRTQMEPHSCNLRKHRQEHGTFFVTKCLQPKLGVIKEDVAEVICSALCFSASKQQILLAAFVVMPDHWHALFGCQDEKEISKRMAALNRWISRRSSSHLKAFNVTWQDNFYETRIKSARQFQFIRGYVEENPVRAGLVSSISDWPWSSANPRFQETLSLPWPWTFSS